jgi:hypothetical protein
MLHTHEQNALRLPIIVIGARFPEKSLQPFWHHTLLHNWCDVVFTMVTQSGQSVPMTRQDKSGRNIKLMIQFHLAPNLACRTLIIRLDRYSVWLQTKWPRFDLRQRQRIFPLASVTSSEAHPASCTIVTGWKLGRGVTLTTHPNLLPSSRMSRSYTSSPPKRLHGLYWDCFFNSVRCVYTDGRNKIQSELEIQPVIQSGIFWLNCLFIVTVFQLTEPRNVSKVRKHVASHTLCRTVIAVGSKRLLSNDICGHSLIYAASKPFVVA